MDRHVAAPAKANTWLLSPPKAAFHASLLAAQTVLFFRKRVPLRHSRKDEPSRTTSQLWPPSSILFTCSPIASLKNGGQAGIERLQPP